MILTVFYVLVIAALALGGMYLFDEETGYVLINFAGYTLETTLAASVVMAIVVYLIVYFSLRLLVNLVTPSGLTGRFIGARRQQGNERRIQQGLLAYLEGNWDKARRLLSKAAGRSSLPALQYLIAARASQSLGEDEQSQQLLKQAEKKPGIANLAISITRAELQLADGQLEECLATLTRLRRKAPRQRLVLKLLMEVYKRLEDWESLAKLLTDISKARLLTAARFNELEQQVYGNMLRVAERRQQTNPQALTQAWQKIPKAIQRDPTLLVDYVEALLRCQQGAEAERLLRTFLKRDWDNRLVRLYGIVQGEDASRQLLLAENWLKARPNNGALMLCLGRLCLANKQWDKAREYLETSLNIQEDAETCAELGRLLARLGEYERSAEYLQQGLRLQCSQVLPELPLP